MSVLKVLKTYPEKRELPDGSFKWVTCEVKESNEDDENGQYQLWVDGDYERDFTQKWLNHQSPLAWFGNEGLVDDEFTEYIEEKPQRKGTGKATKKENTEIRTLLSALEKSAISCEETRMEGLDHLGGFLTPMWQALNYAYITLHIHEPNKQYSTDVLWKKEKFGGLEDAIKGVKKQEKWKTLYDNWDRIYYRSNEQYWNSNIDTSEVKKFGKLTDLQEKAEDWPGSYTLTLITK